MEFKLLSDEEIKKHLVEIAFSLTKKKMEIVCVEIPYKEQIIKIKCQISVKNGR